MKTLAVFAAVVVAAMAKPLGEEVVHVRQDSLGNYDINYGVRGVSRVEQHSRRAVPVLTSVGYVPEELAVLSPHDTPEVTEAKAEHLAIHRATELSQLAPEVEVVKVVETPIVTVPITYTPGIVYVAPEVGRVFVY